MRKFTKIKCSCGKTLAYKIEDKVEIKCQKCGKENIIVREIQFEPTQHLVEAN